MNKKDLVSRASEILRLNQTRKPVKIKKHKFTIIDEEGNTADFTVKRADKQVLYTVDDINNIIDACIEAILESIRRGEEVNIRGFGTLGLHYRAARRTKQPGTDDWCEIDAHYIPKFFSGNDLKAAVKVYDLSRKGMTLDDYDFVEDEDGDDE